MTSRVELPGSCHSTRPAVVKKENPTGKYVPAGDRAEGLSFEQMLTKLHMLFESDRVNVEEVKEVLSSYRSNRKDWKKYAKWDQHRYTRNLVDDGNGKFNLLALCWGEGHGSSIHSHGNGDCFVKVLDGHLLETMFQWPGEEEEGKQMEEIGKQLYSKNGVTYICDDMGLHRMENPSHSEGTVTLHLYAPPYEMVDTFDERTGHKRAVRITLWSKFGKKTNVPEAGSSEPRHSMNDEAENN